MAEVSHHPYIAEVRTSGLTADSRPFIVMKYYGGPTYAQRVREAPFSVPEVLRAGIRLACAVETAHRSGIVHRDIKPANVLTDLYGSPALTDFGIAAVSERTRDSPEAMSLPWAPPEAVYRTSPPDVRSDVYSLGATLWHLLVGRSPLEVPGGDNSTVALMRRIQSTPPPGTGRGDVPGSLERLLAVSMAKSPDDRPPSAFQLARALQEIEVEQRLQATELTLIGESVRAVARSRTAVAADPTRIRAPQVVEAQPPRAPTSSAVISRAPATADTASPRVSRRGPEVPRHDTQVKAPKYVEPEAEPELSVPTSAPAVAVRSVRRTLIVAFGGLLVVGVVGAVLLTRGGPATGKTAASTPTPHDVFVTATPGTPAVQVSLAPDGRSAVFRWGGYANALTSDTFRWRRSGSGTAREGVATSPSLRVKVPRSGVVCLSVQVIRNDGSSPSTFSPVVCSR